MRNSLLITALGLALIGAAALAVDVTPQNASNPRTVPASVTAANGAVLTSTGGLKLVTPAGNIGTGTNTVTIADPGVGQTIGRTMTIIIVGAPTNLLLTSGSNITGTDPELGDNDVLVLQAIATNEWLIIDARNN